MTIPAKYNDAESALGVVDELRSRLAYGLFPGLPVINRLSFMSQLHEPIWRQCVSFCLKGNGTIFL